MKLLLVSKRPGALGEVPDQPAPGSRDAGEEEQLTVAESIEAGLAALGKGNFDVVVADLEMPGCAGLDALLQLQGKARDEPMIAIVADDGLGLSAIDSGAQDFLKVEDSSWERVWRAARCAVRRSRLSARSTRDAELLDALLRNIPDRIYFKDLGSRFVRGNIAMARFFGVDDPSELIGKTDFDFFTDEHARPAFQDEQMLIRGGVPVVHKVEKETFPDGKITWSLTTKMPWRDRTGRLIGTFGVSHDVTRLRQTEDALERERNRLREASAELTQKNKLLESDLRLARDVQEALLPHEFPAFPAGVPAEASLLRFFHRYRPTQEVGGDFFNVFRILDMQAGVFVCDVMGHGARAAMVTAVIKGVSEELKPLAANPGKYLEALNRKLTTIFATAEDPALCTAFFMAIDAATGNVQFASAGHPSPVRLCHDPSHVRLLADSDSRHGPVLGLTPDAAYPVGEFLLPLGESVAIFTDGLFEICDPETGKEFGLDGLLEAFRDSAGLDSDLLLDNVLTKAESACTGEFSDDLCLLLVKRERPASG